VIAEIFGPPPTSDKEDEWDTMMEAFMKVVLDKKGGAAVQSSITQLLNMGPCKY
jgi:hypothetical protein